MAYSCSGCFRDIAEEAPVTLIFEFPSAKAWDDAETVESLMIGWTGKIFHRECAPDG